MKHFFLLATFFFIPLTVVGSNLPSRDSNSVRIRGDDQNNNLFLSIYQEKIFEGDSANATLWFNQVADKDRWVSLSTSRSGQLTLPTGITIPKGQQKVEFSIRARNDNAVDEGDQVIKITAKSADEGQTTADMVIFDGDRVKKGKVAVFMAASMVSNSDNDTVFEADERADFLIAVGKANTSDSRRIVKVDVVMEVLDAHDKLWITSSSNGKRRCTIYIKSGDLADDCRITLIADDNLPSGRYHLAITGTAESESFSDYVSISIVNNASLDFWASMNLNAVALQKLKPGQKELLPAVAIHQNDGFSPTLPTFQLKQRNLTTGTIKTVAEAYPNVRGFVHKQEEVYFPFTAPLQAGSYQIWAEINPAGTGRITESNYSNNKSTVYAIKVGSSTYKLTVNVVGNGTVNGQNCSNNTCEYDHNADVKLTAIPAANSTFSSWRNCDSPSGAVCNVKMSSDKNVTATFDKDIVPPTTPPVPLPPTTPPIPSGIVVNSVSVQPIKASVNQPLDIKLQIQAGTQQIDSAGIYLNYDKNLLKVNSVIKDSKLDMVVENNFTTLGQIKFSAISLADNKPSGTFDALTLNITPLAAGTATLSFNTTSSLLSGGEEIPANFENITLQITAGSLVKGSVSLKGRQPAPHASWITELEVKFYLSGQTNPRYSETVTTDEWGRFEFPERIETGSYQITVKAKHTLQVMKTVQITAGKDVTLSFEEFREGDANNDNKVDLRDFSLLASSFNKCQGQADYRKEADFNGDDCVNLKDFSLLAGNFNQTGGGIGTSSRPTTRRRSQKAGTEPNNDAVAMVISDTTTSLTQGTQFDITVAVQVGTQTVNASALYGFFDPSVLAVNSITAGDALDTTLFENYDNTSGVIHFEAGTLSGEITSDFELLTIHFEVKKDVAHTAFSLVPNKTEILFAGDSVPMSVETFVLEHNANAQAFPSLSNANAIDVAGNSLEIFTRFAGGIAVNGASYQNTTIAKPTDPVDITGVIMVDTTVAPIHVGQSADIVVVAMYQPFINTDLPTPTPALGDPLFFMLEKNGGIHLWDLDFAKLVPFDSITLDALQKISLYQKPLSVTGSVQMFFGYRLADGMLVFSIQPIDITITD